MRPALTILTLILAAAGAGQAPPPQGDGLEALLRRAAAYVADYEREIPAVVAEEEYTQRFIVEPNTQVRHLRSDLLTVRDDAEGWVGFRDVFEIDGRPVRDRTDRLLELFLEPHADARQQARRIAEESARFNVAPQAPRTINTPLVALQFIRAQNQDRSTFTDGGRKVVAGAEIRIVKFQEQALPRMVRTPDGAAARGRFWIDVESGRIVETEMFLYTRQRLTSISALIHVVYALEPRLHLWLPASMDENYQGFGVITGHASYTHFRKFGVTTDAIVKGP